MMKYKKKCALCLHSLYNYWFCYENGKKELSTNSFRRMQIQTKKIKMPEFKDAKLESDSSWF